VTKPVGDIEAAHAVMTVADTVFVAVEFLEVLGNRAHRDELRAFDAALSVLLGFADIHK
jgi:hypothetical protein